MQIPGELPPEVWAAQRSLPAVVVRVESLQGEPTVLQVMSVT